MLKLSLQNLKYANNGPLLLTVILGRRVVKGKNLAAFLFAGSSILFFPLQIEKVSRERTKMRFSVKYGRIQKVGSTDVEVLSVFRRWHPLFIIFWALIALAPPLPYHRHCVVMIA